MNINYPEEWNELPKYERKMKIKELSQEIEQKAGLVKKITKWGVISFTLVLIVVGLILLTKKSPEQIALEQDTKAISLDGRVEKFTIEGRNHVSVGTNVDYKTNPPTSGDHLAEAKNWGVYNKEIDDKAGIHALEHGGIWISYKDIDEKSKKVLEDIGKFNPQSVIVSPRLANDDKIVVTSWGKMMKLDTVDKALIQKYINIYKNQSPEKIAR